MLKGQKKHIDKEQGTTKHEAPRSVNYRATQNKNNIGTTSFEWSIVYTTRDLNAFHCINFTLHIILNTKIYKKFASHNGFPTQSMHLSENQNQIDHCDETKKEYSWIMQARVKENH